MIRPATLSDKSALFALAQKLSLRFYPQMRLDVAKLNTALVALLQGPENFAWVSEGPDGVTGALIAATADNLWAQRKNSHALVWTAKVPLDGARLLRQYRDWVKERRAIRVAGFYPDCEVDSRALRLLSRTGFKRHGGAYQFFN